MVFPPGRTREAGFRGRRRDRVLGPDEPPGLAHCRTLAGRHSIASLHSRPLLQPRGTTRCVRSGGHPARRGGGKQMISSDPHAPALRRELRLRDLVFFDICAIVSLRWVAAAAHAGPGSFVLWIIAALFFFLPSAITVSSLSRRMPEEG